MCPGLSADLQQMDDPRKTAIITKELTRLNIDVAFSRRLGWPIAVLLENQTTPSFHKASPRTSRGSMV